MAIVNLSPAMQQYMDLKEQYPEKTVQVYLEKPPVKFSYLDYFDQISQNPAEDVIYDLCICLDSADKERLGAFGRYLETAAHSICLDHHITNRGYCEENAVVPDASSTCEVIYGFLEKDKISTAAAACIYTGIIHDTNVFKNSNTTAKTTVNTALRYDSSTVFTVFVSRHHISFLL